MELTLDSAGLPLYQQLAQQLQAQIANGAFSVGERLKGDKELAAELGVSPVTVTRAYRLLMERGLLIRKPGFGTCVSRARSRSGVIGVIASDLVPEWTGVILDEFNAVLSANDYKLQLFHIAGQDPVKEYELLRSLNQETIDGVFAMTCGGLELHYAALEERGVAVILGTKPFKRLAYVSIDDFRVGEMAAAHLWECGIREFAAVIEDYPVGRERLAGFRLGLMRHQVELAPERIFWARRNALTDNEIPDALNWFLQSGATGVFAHADLYLAQLYHAMLLDGKHHPREFAWIGAGNADNQHRLPLTSIDFNLPKLGAEAARRLLARIDGTETLPAGQSLGSVVEPSLQIRESTQHFFNLQ